jgi:hypothetical protein
VKKMNISSTAVSFLLIGAALLGVSTVAHAQPAVNGDVNTGYFGDVAIKGYDPVAYFTVGQPTIGDEKISYEWLGAEWHFATTDNRDRFMADPIKYAPQYGGHCADGLAYVATAVTVNIDPTAWRIIDGKLYLSYDPGSAADFQSGDNLVQKADANWQAFKALTKSK